MRAVLLPFMVIAACGFVLSLVAHLLALSGVTLPGGGLVWALHGGIFVVWIPAILVSGQMTRYSPSRDLWKTALAGCAPWMRRAVWIIFGYAFFNFVLFMASDMANPTPHTGSAPPAVIRAFSGHWMVFYSVAFALLYSRLHAPQLYEERRCPNGHRVSPLARYCSECGHPVSALESAA